MDEQLKQTLMIGAIGGASTVMIYQFTYYFTLQRGESFSVLGVLGGVGLGLVVGAIAGVISFAMLRNR